METTKKYKLTGLTCMHCVKKVTDAMQSIDGVVATEVTLKPLEAIITFGKPVALEVLQSTVANAGNYTLSEFQ